MSRLEIKFMSDNDRVFEMYLEGPEAFAGLSTHNNGEPINLNTAEAAESFKVTNYEQMLVVSMMHVATHIGVYDPHEAKSLYPNNNLDSQKPEQDDFT